MRIIQEYVNGEYLYIPRKEEEQKQKPGEGLGIEARNLGIDDERDG